MISQKLYEKVGAGTSGKALMPAKGRLDKNCLVIKEERLFFAEGVYGLTVLPCVLVNQSRHRGGGAN